MSDSKYRPAELHEIAAEWAAAARHFGVYEQLEHEADENHEPPHP